MGIKKVLQTSMVALTLTSAAACSRAESFDTDQTNIKPKQPTTEEVPNYVDFFNEKSTSPEDHSNYVLRVQYNRRIQQIIIEDLVDRSNWFEVIYHDSLKGYFPENNFQVRGDFPQPIAEYGYRARITNEDGEILKTCRPEKEIPDCVYGNTVMQYKAIPPEIAAGVDLDE